MKLALAFVAAAWAQENVDQCSTEAADDTWVSNCKEASDSPAPRSFSGSDEDRGEIRRYADLKKMAIKLWAKNGLKGKKNGFDEKDYWAYGCHCMLLGDRPMSQMGKGSPVDALDNRCKAYKDCQKCVREKHGDDCIGEFITYTWRWNSRLGQLQSKDAEGSCARELMECDKKFVEDTFQTKDVFSKQYHAFYAVQEGFPAWEGPDDDDNCPTGGSGPVDHECCGGGKTYYTWMNKNTQECCAKDGKDQAVNIGQC